jgi:hypothetical protein
MRQTHSQLSLVVSVPRPGTLGGMAPTLYATCGLPFAGKLAAASALAERTGVEARKGDHRASGPGGL